MDKKRICIVVFISLWCSEPSLYCREHHLLHCTAVPEDSWEEAIQSVSSKFLIL